MGRKRKLWRQSFGDKGVNRVTVYEKRGGKQLYVEWWDDLGRHQKAIGSLIGEPVTDKEIAVDLAKELAKAQKQKRNRRAASIIYGFSPDRTLGQLLERLHADKWGDWKPSYRRDQKRFRSFWEDELGKGTPLVKMSPAMIQAAVRRESSRRDWSSATRKRYLRYIVDAFSYAQKQLKWIREEHNLSAVRMPKVRSESKAYTKAEVARLVPALAEVDPRAGFVGHVAWQTGRRLNAIRMLRRGDVRMEGDVAVLFFQGETDKAKNTGETPIAGAALELLDALLAHGRDYLVSEEGGEPVSKETLIKDWLPRAEEIAGIQHVSGRAYHGIKRQFATATRGMEGRDKQSGTLERTLDREYRQDEMEPKIALAKQLARRLEQE